MIRGSVDFIDTRLAIGWITYASEEDLLRRSALTVTALINNEVIGEAVANLPRPDLAAAGFGDGHCGFELRFSKEVDPLYLPFVELRLADSDLELPRRTTAGFADYFRVLHQRYPGASRSASVFGGLWTDCSDAIARVKSRADIGLLTSTDAGLLSRFVQEGLLVSTCDAVKTPASSVGRRKQDRIAGMVADVMFNDRMLGLLRAVFDDHPLAIRAELVDAAETEFCQPSASEELPSPAECLSLVAPVDASEVAIEVIRGSHRLPEFLPDGLSRWTRAAAARAAELAAAPHLAADRYALATDEAALIGPGTLHRIALGPDSTALKIFVVPARQGLLRFQQQKPRGEMAHESGARIWLV